MSHAGVRRPLVKLSTLSDWFNGNGASAGSIPALGTISFNELQQDDTEVVRWYQLAAGPGQGAVQFAKFVMLIRTS